MLQKLRRYLETARFRHAVFALPVAFMGAVQRSKFDVERCTSNEMTSAWY